MRADHPDDDIALLIARTRALHSDRVAAWDLASDPAIVAQARKAPPTNWPPGDWTRPPSPPN